MTLLSDIIEINPSESSVIVVENSLANQKLVASFAPTKAVVKVLKHLREAVLPPEKEAQTHPEKRAINLFGSYGSGKSHLAVVIAQLLRDGSGSAEFDGFFQRLSHFGEPELAQRLKNTFLPGDDKDAKPYLLVSLYSSEAPTLGDQLMEGLCEALKRKKLDLKDILPTTEYDACIQRFAEIVANSPEYANADLSNWQLSNSDYLATSDMLKALEKHQSSALTVFKEWHKAVCFGAKFNPTQEGAHNFIKAYAEAGKNLAEKHNFAGILVIWDEFGNALEHLMDDSSRISSKEINDLQSFVETVCRPTHGHTIFIGLTHYSFTEYATKMGSTDENIIEKLGKISRRFNDNKPFKIELSATESEGYHLLGMQKTWTTQGKQYLDNAQPSQRQIIDNCASLPLFKTLSPHLDQVLNECYPLHPITAAGLFELSNLPKFSVAQSNSTALTFFRDYVQTVLARQLSEQGLFSNELIRLPELVDYYLERLKEVKSADCEQYQRALTQITGDLTEQQIRSKQAIVKLLFLAPLLGGNFQATETFLASALYDAKPNSLIAQNLSTDLAWLKKADVCWKHDVTEQWTLAGDSGVNIEEAINGKLTNFANLSVEDLFNKHDEMLADLLPPVGIHDLEPSACGIIRSYQVQLLSPTRISQLKFNNPLISAQVFLVLANTEEEANQAKQHISELSDATAYFWLPLAGLLAEAVEIEGKQFRLSSLLCRYLAIESLLKENPSGEELRRQLGAKWEKTRQQLLAVLQVLYGRPGLESGNSQILTAGSLDPLACQSWHGLRELIAEEIQATYPKEIPIRAMNLNSLRDESYLGRSVVQDIVKRILEFDNNLDYRTNDLLGETKDTSQPASLIDGTLGANQIFIQRANGLDIKKVIETDNGIKEVLGLIHDTLLKKRDKPYLMQDLREKLIAPPYGIPACTLAIFAAVAIRHEVKRLRWYGSKETDFSSNLNNAFSQESKLSIRLIEFGNKQYAMLNTVGQYFDMRRKPEETPEEFGSDCAAKLREFIKNQPEAVKDSSQLDHSSKDLIRFLREVAKSTQDLADFLLKLFELENKSHVDIPELAKPLVKGLLDDFSRVANGKKYEIQKAWEHLSPKNDTDKTELLERLNHQYANHQAKQLALLLERSPDIARIDADEFSQLILQKNSSQCSDIEIGECKAELKALINYHPRLPPPLPISPTPPVISPEVREFSTVEFINTLRMKIQQTGLSNPKIREILQSLLSNYQD